MATTEKPTKTSTTRKKTTTRRKSTAAGKTKTASAAKPTTAAPKTSAAAKTKPKVTGVTEAPNPAPETIYAATDPATPAPSGLYKMQELMGALEGKSELKRSELRETVGHVLDALGAALSDGHDLSLPGLGKITVKRREDKPNGEQIVARIKLVAAAPGLGSKPSLLKE